MAGSRPNPTLVVPLFPAPKVFAGLSSSRNTTRVGCPCHCGNEILQSFRGPSSHTSLARAPPLGPSQFLFCASNPPPPRCMLGIRSSIRSAFPGEACVAHKIHKLDLTQVSEWDDGQLRRKDDYLAAEEPLEI